MARITDKMLAGRLQQARKATGLPLNFHIHNSKGYGLLYLQKPGSTGVDNLIAGSMWEGITRQQAISILDTLETLHYRGADFSAVLETL